LVERKTESIAARGEGDALPYTTVNPAHESEEMFHLDGSRSIILPLSSRQKPGLLLPQFSKWSVVHRLGVRYWFPAGNRIQASSDCFWTCRQGTAERKATGQSNGVKHPYPSTRACQIRSSIPPHGLSERSRIKGSADACGERLTNAIRTTHRCAWWILRCAGDGTSVAADRAFPAGT